MQDARSSVTDGTSVSFGPGVHNDDELRVCGVVKGKRVLELGLFGTIPNSVTMSAQGARAIAVDPSGTAISRARRAAADLGVVVEFHQSELADLGFLMNAVVDLVVCAHHIELSTDFARVFRQVHRVLRPEAGFVLALTHPMAAVFDGPEPFARHRYGSTSPTIGDLAMGLQRANFSIDVIHELTPLATPTAMAPAVLVIRAHKLGS